MNKRELFTGLAVSTALLAISTACAHADPQVGNGNTSSNGVDVVSPSNGNHSVMVQTIDGVTTVIVDGRELHGAEAQPYIDAAKAKRRR